jgi:hypothetical protein
LACAPAPFAWGASQITKSNITSPGAVSSAAIAGGTRFTVTPDRIGTHPCMPKKSLLFAFSKKRFLCPAFKSICSDAISMP